MRWGYGYYLGRLDRSNEYIIGTSTGIKTAVALKRLPEDEKWDADGVAQIKGAPWDSQPKEAEVIEAPTVEPRPIPPVGGDRAGASVPQPDETAERRVYLTKEIVRRYGATKGCPGCKEIGKHHLPHCRDRLEECVRKDQEEKQKELQEQIDELREQLKKAEEEKSDDEEVVAPEGPVGMDDTELEELATSKEEPWRHRKLTRSVPEDSRYEEEGAEGVKKKNKPTEETTSGAASSSSQMPKDESGEKRKVPVIGSWITHADAKAKKKKDGDAILVLEQGRPPVLRFGDMELRMEDGCDKSEIQAIEEMLEIYDEMTGTLLDPVLVAKARAEEMDEVHGHKVYYKMPRADGMALAQKLGKKVWKVRWIDLNQGDEKEPRYRSRLVCCELKKGIENVEWYAATPPLFIMKAFLSMCATDLHRSGRPLKLLFLDVRRAFFWATATDWVFIELVDEDKTEGKDEIGVIEPGEGKSMYGSRSAARNWQEAVHTVVVQGLGFKPVLSSPCLFGHEERDTKMMVHGDDFIIISDDDNCEWSETELRKHWTLKRKAKLGPDEDDDKEVLCLNRVIRYETYGVELEPDPRHAELIIAECGMQHSRGVNTPGTKEPGTEIGDDVPSDASTSVAYRGISARGLYLSTERLEARYATKELARSSKNPTQGSVKGLKRLARFYKKFPRVVTVYRWQGRRAGQPHIRKLTSKADSNHANCPMTRRSTSGGVLMRGCHCWDGWSSTQEIVTISSGESEFMAGLKAACQLLAALSMMSEIGLVLEGEVETDSSAGLGMSSKIGLQKTKHIETKYLWIQQAVKQQRFKMKKVDGKTNQADLLTKHVDYVTMQRYMKALGLEVREGRCKISPTLGLMILQQLGEGNAMEVAMTLKTQQASVWSSDEVKEETTGSWWSFVMTILLIAGWEMMKLLLEAMAQEKLMKLWRSWFPARPEVQEEGLNENPEVVADVVNVNADEEQPELPRVQQVQRVRARVRETYMTTNANTRNPTQPSKRSLHPSAQHRYPRDAWTMGRNDPITEEVVSG